MIKNNTFSAFFLSSIALFFAFVASAEEAYADNSADADFAAVEKIQQAMSPIPAEEIRGLNVREFAILAERKRQERQVAAERFLDRHPQDPRRWFVVLWAAGSTGTGSIPAFVLEWAPGDPSVEPTASVVDRAKAAAWQKRITELYRAIEHASDVPDGVKRAIAAKNARVHRKATFASRWQSGQNEMAPDFTVETGNGSTVKLSEYRGKIVVVDFWATWCAPCKAGMPHNQEIASRYKDQDVMVLAVCVWDKRENFDEWVELNSTKYPNIQWVFDPAGPSVDTSIARNHYFVSGIPAQIIVDRSGRVVDAVTGYSQSGKERLNRALSKAGVQIHSSLAVAFEPAR
jgi:thiol-disulfide isomerase/thioredoxin